MTIRQPFMPSYGSNQVLTSAAASAPVTIPAVAKQLNVANTGAAIAYVRTYSSLTVPAPTASAADFPVLPGMAFTITKDDQHDRLAHISATGTTLQVMAGEGF